MAWIAFGIVMTMFVIVFGFFVYATFIRHDVGPWVQTTLGVFDALLGWAVKDIIRYLFPAAAHEDST